MKTIIDRSSGEVLGQVKSEGAVKLLLELAASQGIDVIAVEAINQ